jgi:hypothetical protein
MMAVKAVIAPFAPLSQYGSKSKNQRRKNQRRYIIRFGQQGGLA